MKLKNYLPKKLLIETSIKNGTIIFRTIRTNDPNEIDFKNIGCHWTSDEYYEHTGGGEQGFSKGRYLVTFETKISKGNVNQEATDFSNDEYPSESEVVVQPRTKLNAIMTILDEETGYYFEVSDLRNYKNKTDKSSVKNLPIVINTGNRYDRWVEKFLY